MLPDRDLLLFDRNEKGIMKKITQKSEQVWVNSQNIRVILLFFLVVFSSIGVGFRLYLLQVGASDKFKMIADKQHTLSQSLQGRRGEIYLQGDGDEGLYPVAVNREYPMVYVAPNQVSDSDAVISLLSSVLGKDRSEIEKRISNRSDPFEVIERRISDEQKEIIERADVQGVFVHPEEYRFYPGETLLSHMIGFVGSDGERLLGRYGVEASFEKVLGGESAIVSGKRDAGGRRMFHGEESFEVPSDGSDIVLSIHRTVQYEAERVLKDAIEENDADSGSIVVTDPNTGKVLAMATYPDFNPNEYSKVEDLSIFINHPVQSSYECGSVFKPFTLAMGLDQDKITPESTYTDTGAVHSGGYTIRNSDEKAYGVQTMSRVLEESLNTGTVYVQKTLGNKMFSEYVRRFGFGETTGSGFIGESSGNIKNLEHLNREINFFTASFGQGIAVTPLQLARGYGVLANGGRLMQIQFVDRIIHSDGWIEEIEPKEQRRVIQEGTSKQIGEMLYGVVERGHGKKAKVLGYRVGGKTGTAQVASNEKRGYDSGVTIGTFAGYAPIDDPKFVIVVKIDNPKKVIWAETVAAPAFGKMMTFLLNYAKIPPTEKDQLVQGK